MANKPRYATHGKPNLAEIAKLAEKGATDSQVAQLCGISLTTLYEWKKRYPEFTDAIARAKNKADDLVESALHRSAVGFEYDEVSETSVADNANKKAIRRVVTKKFVPPNPQAAMSWLRNRRPEKWNDTMKIDGQLEVKLTEEEDA